MRRFIQQRRMSGTALLAVFVMQLAAMGFCVIPTAQASPAMTHNVGHAAMHMQCPMPLPAGQNPSGCVHCNSPDSSISPNLSGNIAFSWNPVAVLPALSHQTGPLPARDNAAFTATRSPLRSSSLIYRTSLRIRL